MNQSENNNNNDSPNSPEIEESSAKSVLNKLGSFALRVVEIIAITGATYGAQELIFHESMPLVVNVAMASGAVTMANYTLSKK
jgi:hypothetical protein